MALPRGFRPSLVAAVVLLTALGPGCAQKQPPVETAPALIPDHAALLSLVRERASRLERLDAGLEVTLVGVTSPFGGKLFGTARIDNRPEGLGLWLQAYTLVGVPVLEVISVGPRVEVFSPLDRSVYVNFRGLAEGQPMEEFPLASFEEVALPLELISDQIGLLFGRGICEQCRYDLAETGKSYLVSEYREETLQREMEYEKAGLFLQSVRVYRGGALAGSMGCLDHDPQDPTSGFIPRHIVFERKDVIVSLQLSRLRVNEQVSGPPIDFRLPDVDRYILLTPPVPDQPSSD